MAGKSGSLIYREKEGVVFIEINHIFPKKDFQSHVIEYVKSITANGPMALRVVKEIIDSTLTMNEVDALAFERQKAAENILSRQCIEGISAFLEKRPPDWLPDL